MKWVCYYLWLFLACLAVAGFNLYFSFSFASHKCTPPVVTNATRLRLLERREANFTASEINKEGFSDDMV